MDHRLPDNNDGKKRREHNDNNNYNDVKRRIEPFYFFNKEKLLTIKLFKIELNYYDGVFIVKKLWCVETITNIK